MATDRRRGFAGVAVLVAVLVVAGLAVPVAAHAHLDGSDPARGEVLDDVPPAVVLDFGADSVQLASVSVIAPDGTDVVTDVAIEGADRERVVAQLDAHDEAGNYSVEWEVIADDGHATSGSLFFIVVEGELDREQVLASLEPDERLPVHLGLINGALLVTVLLLLGIPVTVHVAIAPVVSADPATIVGRRTATVLLATVLAATALAFVLGVLRLFDLHGGLSAALIGDFLRVRLGWLWLGQVAIGLLGAAGLRSAARRGAGTRSRVAIGFATGAALAGSMAWASHSAVLVDRLVGSLFDVLHLLGAGLWIGGLAALVLVGLPGLAADGETDPRRVASMVGRFSVVALAGVTLAVLSGSILFAWHVPTPDALWTTTHGSVLSVKVGLLVVALGLGAFHRAVVLRRLRRGATGAVDALRTGGRIEFAVLIAVVLAAGLVTSVAPAAMVIGHAAPTSDLTLGEGAGEVELTVVPAEITPDDRFVLSAGDPTVLDVTPAGEVAIEDPSIVLTHPEEGLSAELDLVPSVDGTLSAVYAFPAEGNWDITLEYRVAGERYEAVAQAAVFDPEHAHLHADPYDTVSEFGELVRLVGIVIAFLGFLAFAYEANSMLARDRGG